MDEGNMEGADKAFDDIISWLKNGNIKPLKELFCTFEKSSDVVVAIMSYAYIEELLEKYLKAYFKKNSKEIDELFHPHGPLNSMWAKSRIAYALDLISKNVLNDLNMIQKVRNEFAHRLHSTKNFNFGHEPVQSFCRELEYGSSYKKKREKNNKKVARKQFQEAVSRLAGRLIAKIAIAQNK